MSIHYSKFGVSFEKSPSADQAQYSFDKFAGKGHQVERLGSPLRDSSFTMYFKSKEACRHSDFKLSEGSSPEKNEKKQWTPIKSAEPDEHVIYKYEIK